MALINLAIMKHTHQSVECMSKEVEDAVERKVEKLQKLLDLARQVMNLSSSFNIRSMKPIFHWKYVELKPEDLQLKQKLVFMNH